MENNQQKNNEFLNQKRKTTNSLPILPSKEKIEDSKIEKNEFEKDKNEEPICHFCKTNKGIIEIKKVEDIFKYLKRVNLFKPEYLDFEKKYQELKVEKYLCKNCINKINLSNNGGINYIINILNLNIENNLNKNEKTNLEMFVSNFINLINLFSNNPLNVFNGINNFNFFSNSLNQNNTQNILSQSYINNSIIPNLMNIPNNNSNVPLINEEDKKLTNELQKQINMMKLCNQYQKNSLDNIYKNLRELYKEIFNHKRINQNQKENLVFENNNQLNQNIHNNFINNNNLKKFK